MSSSSSNADRPEIGPRPDQPPGAIGVLIRSTPAILIASS